MLFESDWLWTITDYAKTKFEFALFTDERKK
jgi:hypothetical protein